MNIGRSLTALATVALAVGLIGFVGAMPSSGQTLPPIGPPGDAPCSFGIANGISSATFLCVDGVSPWAALVVNPSIAGIDSITIEYDAASRTLTIAATDDDPVASVTILVNKAFLEEHVDGFLSDRDLRMTDGVVYDGDGTHPLAAGQAMIVFQITHFSTQTITIAPGTTMLTGVVLGGLVLAVVAAVAIRRLRK